MRLLTSEQLVMFTGLPKGTLKRLRASGALVPAQGKGRPHRDYWSAPQALGISIGRALRQRGVSLDQADAVREYLSALPIEQLEARILSGHRFIAIVGSMALPRLLTLEAIHDNEMAPDADTIVRAVLARPVAMDVGVAWLQLQRALEALESEQTAGK